MQVPSPHVDVHVYALQHQPWPVLYLQLPVAMDLFLLRSRHIWHCHSSPPMMATCGRY